MGASVRDFAERLPRGIAADPLVQEALVAASEMDIDGAWQRLVGQSDQRQGKPYLHAVETEKLRDTHYDEVVEDVKPVPPRLGTLYLHLPFCVKRCAHCHYYKEIDVADNAIAAFPAYLEKELSMVMNKLNIEMISTEALHYGGGTPSLLAVAQWENLVARIGQFVTLEKDDEVTIEASPEDVTREKAAAWRASGVNRVSLGIQSFDDATLGLLNRNHDACQSEQSYQVTLETGFDNINVDLMYGMPGRTFGSWLHDVRRVLALLPESVTIYATRPDPADRLEKHKEFPGEEERIFAHLLALNALLGAEYIQYSPNQFIRSYKGACKAKRERNRCHNVLGIGPLAHSIIKNWFYYNKSNLNAYRAALDRGELSRLKGARMSPQQERDRFIQFGLKLSGVNKPADDNGVLKDGYQDCFGETIESRFADSIRILVDQGLLVVDAANFHLSKKGILLTREVVRYFGDPAN